MYDRTRLGQLRHGDDRGHQRINDDQRDEQDRTYEFLQPNGHMNISVAGFD